MNVINFKDFFSFCDISPPQFIEYSDVFWLLFFSLVRGNLFIVPFVLLLNKKLLPRDRVVCVCYV